jgi:hypothetical protein
VRIDIGKEGPINDAFLALNHYISTGDHVGEGIAMYWHDGRIAFNVPYAPRELEDKDNWTRLEARLHQMQADDDFSVEIQDGGMTPGGFRVMILLLAEDDVPAFTLALKEKPGPIGWGSMRSFLISKGILPPD